MILSAHQCRGDRMPDMPDPPEEAEVPAYMVSFGDMITLLLTFFILLVALADTQTAGLVGAGQGPLIRHLNAKGEPGILQGRLKPDRQKHKRDSWWIPDQKGDPDQLVEVRTKLEKEILNKFKPGEASVGYEKDSLVLRLPARIRYDASGYSILDQGVMDVLEEVAYQLRRKPGRHVRISGDVGQMDTLGEELTESARLGRVVSANLQLMGVAQWQMSLWGWGTSRSAFPDERDQSLARSVTLEVIEAPRSAAGGDE